MSGEAWVTVKIRSGPAEKARLLSSLRRQTLADYVSEALASVVDGPYERLTRQIPDEFLGGADRAEANGSEPLEGTSLAREAPGPHPASGSPSSSSCPARQRQRKSSREEVKARRERILRLHLGDPTRTQLSIAQELGVDPSEVSKTISAARRSKESKGAGDPAPVRSNSDGQGWEDEE